MATEGANRYWMAGVHSFYIYKDNVILEPKLHLPWEENPIIRKTKMLEHRFKNKLHTKTVMKPLPFPKGA